MRFVFKERPLGGIFGDAIDKMFTNLRFESYVEDHTAGTVDFEVSTMYARPEITFELLESLSKLFGTKLINLGDGRKDNGCDTCDYGSSYGVEIHAKGVVFASKE